MPIGEVWRTTETRGPEAGETGSWEANSAGFTERFSRLHPPRGTDQVFVVRVGYVLDDNANRLRRTGISGRKGQEPPFYIRLVHLQVFNKYRFLDYGGRQHAKSQGACGLDVPRSDVIDSVGPRARV